MSQIDWTKSMQQTFEFYKVDPLTWKDLDPLDKIEKQTARLRKIALEAAKQCGRGVVPEISEPLSFSDMIRDAGENCDAVLFCYENEKTESLYSSE